MFLYDNNTDYRESFRQYWNNNVKKFRTGSMIAGIVMIVLGILCMVFPVETIVVIEVIASIALLAVGIAEVAAYAEALFRIASERHSQYHARRDAVE